MIDFRYHLVSIIAVFLALAVGIVVGTTALNGPVLDGLRESNAGLLGSNEGLRSDVRDLESEVDTADDFTRALADDLVGGRLEEQGVLLVLTPGADRQIADQLTTMITEAGGQVTGRLAVQPALLDPEQGQLVDDIVAQVVQPGIELPAGPAVARAAAELAAALVFRPDLDIPLDRDGAQQIVSAFEEAGLIELTDAGDELVVAGAAVVLSGPAPSEEDEEVDGDLRLSELEGQLALARELDARAAGTVVAGPLESAVDGGLVRAVRSDGSLAAEVSTVDNVHRGVGQVAVVRALVEQFAGGAGRYGATGTATEPVPTGAPAVPE